jgi:lysine 2-monooxygenase
MELDIAIIGGGVSGAYCAWRLQQARGEKESIALFEYSDRIGGRLLSVALPGLPDVYAELGGMRYIPDQHVIVARLVDHLGLPTKNFPMGAPPPIGADCNLFYLRGKNLRYHEIVEPGVLPYNLSWNERGLGPEALQTKIMNYIYPNFGGLSLCQQMKVKAFGKELWKYGFWDLLYRVLTNEGYQYMRDAGGYEANVANSNAVTQLPATEYKDTTQFLTLKDGFDELPIALAEQFRDKFPGVLPHAQRLHMNHRLARIEINKKAADYPYTLHFQPTQTTNRKTTDRPKAKPVVVKAKQIILAMPRRSLELIDSDFFKNAWLQENIPSVLIQPAFKIFLAYEKPWWRSLGLVAGRSVTDLPIRQVYYFGAECEQPGGYPYLNSLLMASYNDLSTVPFWKGLESGATYKGYQPACLEKPYDEIVPAHQFNLTDEMVTIAQRQLAQIHSQQEIPPPYTGIYHDWGEDPYGGGWHEWKANYRLDKIMCQMRHPVEDQQIFIVGEAYSYDQGWVEGALETAESTLEDFFKLPSPVWMHDANYPYLPNPCPGCPDTSDCLECPDCTDMLQAITPNCFKKDDN